MGAAANMDNYNTPNTTNWKEREGEYGTNDFEEAMYTMGNSAGEDEIYTRASMAVADESVYDSGNAPEDIYSVAHEREDSTVYDHGTAEAPASCVDHEPRYSTANLLFGSNESTGAIESLYDMGNGQQEEEATYDMGNGQQQEKEATYDI